MIFEREMTKERHGLGHDFSEKMHVWDHIFDPPTGLECKPEAGDMPKLFKSAYDVRNEYIMNLLFK